MSKRTRTILIVIGVAVAAYLAYRWYSNRNSGSPVNSPTGSLGTNLNSIAPELVAGSTGPTSGLVYNQAPTTVNLTLPNGSQSQTLTGHAESPTGKKGKLWLPAGMPRLFTSDRYEPVFSARNCRRLNCRTLV